MRGSRISQCAVLNKLVEIHGARLNARVSTICGLALPTENVLRLVAYLITSTL
jgi:hypothetical protein